MTAHQDQPNTGLIEYGRIIASHWRWVAWGILLALAVTTVALLIHPPLYRTAATVFVRTPGDVSRVVDGGDSFAQARARTYAALASSPTISGRVIADLGLNMTPQRLAARIKADNRRGTALIVVTVAAPSRADAERIATVFLSEYAATVRGMEGVPGSLVPRAELVTVDPPGPPTLVTIWDASLPELLMSAALVGTVLGALAAVLRSTFSAPPTANPEPPDSDRTADTVDPFTVDDRAEHHRTTSSVAATASIVPIESRREVAFILNGSAGRHRRRRRRFTGVLGLPITHPNEAAS